MTLREYIKVLQQHEKLTGDRVLYDTVHGKEVMAVDVFVADNGAVAIQTDTTIYAG